VTIELSNESGVDVAGADLVDLARFALERLRVHPDSDLSLLLVDDDTMAGLHERWLHEPGPTDVMSFPMDELAPAPDGVEPVPGVLGDIVIAPTFAAAQAATAGTSTAEELDLLCVHGVLHLLGFDHAEPDEHTRMFALQGELLEAWREQRGAVRS
jgi:probable rRNA maturation factor